MPSVDRLAEFTSIIRAGSIMGAAKALGIPRPTLSQRLSRLEDELGVRLLHRGTRRLVLTTAGEELYRRALRITADADEAWTAVRRLDDTPRGLLRVSVATVATPDLFTDFLRDYPEVQLEVRDSTLHVDLVAEGVDVAVRFGEVKDPSLIVKRIHTVRSLVVGSPDYLRRRGDPSAPAALAAHDCVVRFGGEWTPSRTWPLLAGGTIAVGGRLASNSVTLSHAAVLSGQGLSLMPSPVVAADLEAGRLVAVLEETVGATVPVNIVYADREYVEAKVRVFVDRAAEALATYFSGLDSSGAVA